MKSQKGKIERLRLAQRLRQRRIQSGMTLQQIADAAGVTKSTVQRYEQAAIENPRPVVVQGIAAVLGVSPAWLCGAGENNDLEVAFEDVVEKLRVRPELCDLVCAAADYSPSQLRCAVRVVRALSEN
ncbi:MAG TPA: helix-turn-helix domain-containing protein [Candidatus Ruthenibacterium merdavium]|uniref:Helix-turn-helix domain-containing protein n=1 Tax=Candidatus Ruthenibacterium merdavium TaxID=2838752 RepID=A0A9D2TK40_9FIRM|nr:helix-turn-helix domain-containing protein [Candidatus Ruthenibacterium merdavium]